MTYKKKGATTSTKRNKQATAAASTGKNHGDKQQQQQQNNNGVYGPTPDNPFAGKGQPSEPVQYTRAQLTTVVFFALGASRFMEWQRALNQMTGPDGSFFGNGTATTCKDYILTDRATTEDEGSSGIDYDSVCDSEVTLTMMSLKYDISVFMIGIVLFMMIQCWSNDVLLSQLNAILTMTPVSTSLLLLQLCTPYITPRRSKLMTIGSGICMFLALPATGNVLREFRLSSQQGNNNNNNKTGIFISLALGSMMLMYLFETFQWLVNANYNNPDSGLNLGGIINTKDILVLASENLTEWNDAWVVFMYTLMFDKFTMAALLGCVWMFFDEGRQRRFLLVWGVAKFYEYSVVLPSYPTTFLTDLETMKTMTLACSIISGIGWIAPTVVFGGSSGSGSSSDEGKVKAA